MIMSLRHRTGVGAMILVVACKFRVSLSECRALASGPGRRRVRAGAFHKFPVDSDRMIAGSSDRQRT